MTSAIPRTSTGVAKKTANVLYGLDSPNMTMQAEHMVVGAEGPVEIPLPAFLIEHDKGLIMVDTGFHPCVCEDPALLFGDRPETDMIVSKPEQAIEPQLRKLGYTPEDVTHVIVSHLHTDHAGGLFQFPNARFIIGPGELDYGKNPTPESAHLVMERDFLGADVQNYDWTEVTEERHDLFGDGAVELLHLPGHTPGQMAVLVRLPGQNVVLSADVVHLREAVDMLAPAPTDTDPEQAVKSIRKLLQIVEEEDARLWIIHDYRDWAEFGDPLTPIR
ncbi:N-acyl homoserine lactonase family protein [Corynebacterium comes]|uniref:N-acyl homoserine lactonase AttM n=1 Tax=Corynebacterium comes TaxID=2675218 RepID=A0A6B8VJ80_9CORY|nr:N-acyl homoserine lactonase family protein [Corynebacterium comes]QGU04153.1 N-acyl homoserine lactonase AttM [Corynebacterium comes]